MHAPSIKRLQVLGKNHGELYLLEQGLSSRPKHGNNFIAIFESCLVNNKDSRTVNSCDISQLVCSTSLQHDNMLFGILD